MSANSPTYNLSDRFRAGNVSPAQKNTRRLLLFATLLTFALNFIPGSQYLLYPLRLFVTFVHESSHALAFLLTGGDVSYIQVHQDTSGVTPGHAPAWGMFIVYSAGYVGTSIFGALLLQVGRLRSWKNAGRTTLIAATGSMLAITLLFARDPFTFIMGLVIAAMLGAMARFSTPRLAEFFAAFLAVQCSLNALYDLRTLLFITTSMPKLDNDAGFMAQMYFLPAPFWALLWALMSVAILGVSLWSYLRATATNRA